VPDGNGNNSFGTGTGGATDQRASSWIKTNYNTNKNFVPTRWQTRTVRRRRPTLRLNQPADARQPATALAPNEAKRPTGFWRSNVSRRRRLRRLALCRWPARAVGPEQCDEQQGRRDFYRERSVRPTMLTASSRRLPATSRFRSTFRSTDTVYAALENPDTALASQRTSLPTFRAGPILYSGSPFCPRAHCSEHPWCPNGLCSCASTARGYWTVRSDTPNAPAPHYIRQDDGAISIPGQRVYRASPCRQQQRDFSAKRWIRGNSGAANRFGRFSPITYNFGKHTGR